MKITSRTITFVIGGVIIMVLAEANLFGLFYGAISGYAFDVVMGENEKKEKTSR